MGIRYLDSEPQATALRSVHEMSSTAYKCLQTDSKYLTCAFTNSYNLDEGNFPRQNYPVTYEANGYVDVLRSNFILNNPEKIHGNKVLAYIIKHTSDVDSKEDFKLKWDSGEIETGNVRELREFKSKLESLRK